ncbi:MAG TPA: hypothetical protein VL400_22735, partial [Polyangiaceae bacterium]|nr:hypothetical protein [Polyangiaceae bacterium]
ALHLRAATLEARRAPAHEDDAAHAAPAPSISNAAPRANPRAPDSAAPEATATPTGPAPNPSPSPSATPSAMPAPTSGALVAHRAPGPRRAARGPALATPIDAVASATSVASDARPTAVDTAVDGSATPALTANADAVQPTLDAEDDRPARPRLASTFIGVNDAPAREAHAPLGRTWEAPAPRRSASWSLGPTANRFIGLSTTPAGTRSEPADFGVMANVDLGRAFDSF